MNIIARNAGTLALVVVLGGFAYVALRGPNGFSALQEKRKTIETLQLRNANLAADNERKRIRIERLKHSRSEQELEIREKLKLLKEGETQLITADPPSASPAASE